MSCPARSKSPSRWARSASPRASSSRLRSSSWPRACSFSRSHCARIPATRSVSSASSRSISSRRAAAVSSEPMAVFSISSWMIRRSTSSISVGTDDFSMDTREAASSTRSIALSGRKRSAM
jgi:hypothetical protein